MLTAAAILAESPGPLAVRVEVVVSTGSTNDDLVAAARAGAPHGTVLVADAQTAGRGRLGRSWHSPTGDGLPMSVLLRPSSGPAGFPPLALVAGVAIAAALEEVATLDARLKWPNDLLVGGRKVAGLLAEAVGGARPALVLGIGLNVGQASFPPELERSSTSLLLETGRRHERARVAASVLRHLGSALDEASTDSGLEHVLDRWRARSCTLGRRIRVGDLEGVARTVDPNGALLVETELGRSHRVLSGTVVDLGPEDAPTDRLQKRGER